MSKVQVICGSFEPVTFPKWGGKTVIAKVDTGAYSGAVHCSYIELVTRDGEEVLRFSPFSDQEEIYETKKFWQRQVRSSSGHEYTRYLVRTTLLLEGISYPVRISLSDRSAMQYELLLGRRFLRKNAILVDVRMYQKYDPDRLEELALESGESV